MRVISATNRPLAEMVSRGEFREDLLYRINLIAIHLPPLRERPDDIPILAARFLQTLGAGLSPRSAHAQRRRRGAGCRRSRGRATSVSSGSGSSAPCWSAPATRWTWTTSPRPPDGRRARPPRRAARRRDR